MNWNITSLVDCAVSPWKNGGGSTRELVAWPTPETWQWRMSVAEVASDGPFSRFEDVRRWFAVLSGAGVALESDGTSHVMTAQSDPIHFDGDASTTCTLLAGPTQDFNLMTHHALNTRMQRISGHVDIDITHAAIIAIYAIDDATITPTDGEIINLKAASLAWYRTDDATSLTVKSANALWMEIFE